MAQATGWIRFMHRWHARRAARAAQPIPFVTTPEPRTIGSVARGEELVAGTFLFSGHFVQGPTLSIWEVPGANEAVENEVQSCLWLDDLAALGTEAARDRARLWIFDWIARYGKGRGPGWTPDLAGRRLTRWINHALFVLRGQDQDTIETFHRSLAAQTEFLSRRWPLAPKGLPRFDALAGLIHACLVLEDMAPKASPAIEALAADCVSDITPTGGVPSRNPEELLDVLTLLNATVQTLGEANKDIPQDILDAIARIAPVIRALRHADGNLARFHGGGRGREGQLDAALAASGSKALPGPGLHMGYLRLNAGRTTLIADAATPPSGAASVDAHASTLAFELTSGRRPVIVNCGSGRRFGADWRRASRATPSHSTLGIEGRSSSHLGQASRRTNNQQWLSAVPEKVLFSTSEADQMRRSELSHDGYRPDLGLTHARILKLSVDGRTLQGEDLLATLDDADEQRFTDAVARSGQSGLPFTIRFHLHPDVEAIHNTPKDQIEIQLGSGENWVFQHDGTAAMTLVPSVYLEIGRLKPRQSQQVVLSWRAMSYATRIRWSLEKAADTPDVIRDVTDLADVTG